MERVKIRLLLYYRVLKKSKGTLMLVKRNTINFSISSQRDARLSSSHTVINSMEIQNEFPIT